MTRELSTAEESALRELYYDPRTGYASAFVMRERLQARGHNVPVFQIQAWINRQQVSQLTRPKLPATKIPYMSIISDYPHHQWFADLAIMSTESNAKRHNRGYRYLLTVIDGYSRYVWQVPLKRKNTPAMVQAFKDLFKQTHTSPRVLQTDAGSEFINKPVRDLLARRRITHRIVDPHNHNAQALVERVHRTLKGRMEKWVTAQGRRNWIDGYKTILRNYNTSIHRTLNRTPQQALQDTHEQAAELTAVNQRLRGVEREQTREHTQAFAPNTRVRVLLNKDAAFRKERPQWSTETYDVQHTDGIWVHLDNDQRYKWYHLLKADDSELAPGRRNTRRRPLATHEQRAAERRTQRRTDRARRTLD